MSTDIIFDAGMFRAAITLNIVILNTASMRPTQLNVFFRQRLGCYSNCHWIVHDRQYVLAKDPNKVGISTASGATEQTIFLDKIILLKCHK